MSGRLGKEDLFGVQRAAPERLELRVAYRSRRRLVHLTPSGGSPMPRPAEPEMTTRSKRSANSWTSVTSRDGPKLRTLRTRRDNDQRPSPSRVERPHHQLALERALEKVGGAVVDVEDAAAALARAGVAGVAGDELVGDAAGAGFGDEPGP